MIASGTGAESSRVRDPGRDALPRGSVSGATEEGFVSGLSPASHLPRATFRSTQGPSGWRAHLSAKMDSAAGASGRLSGLSSLFPAPPEFAVGFVAAC